MSTNILGDYQICISVPLINSFAGEIKLEIIIRSTQLTLSKNCSVYLYLGMLHF